MAESVEGVFLPPQRTSDVPSHLQTLIGGVSIITSDMFTLRVSAKDPLTIVPYKYDQQSRGLAQSVASIFMGVRIFSFTHGCSFTPQYRSVWGSEDPWAGLSVIGMLDAPAGDGLGRF